MRLIGPEDMKDFRCRAGACRHTCCRGWEIDIDEESEKRYMAAEGRIGERLRESMERDADGAHFRLDAEERCPFLNREGLCDLIIALGEDALCQVCSDHPRFRNFFSDHVEIGLGLVCEEAARMTILRDVPMQLMVLEDDGEREEVPEAEEELSGVRRALTALAQNRGMPMEDRIQGIRGCLQLPACPVNRAWTDFFSGLETLDPVWPDLLGKAGEQTGTAWLADTMETPAEQLLCYLLYRHLPGALEDGMLRERVQMCLLFLELIFRVCAVLPMEKTAALMEASRLFSGEIEYSDENIGRILDRLSEALQEG